MVFKSVTLDTDRLHEVAHFYGETLGFPVEDSTETSVSFQIGDTVLRFRQTDEPATYHFAINVAHGQMAATQAWLSSKVTPLTHRDEAIVRFDNWSASAIYFVDPASNIVEFIDREEAREMRISEIGVVVPDVPQVCDRLKAELSLRAYRDSESPEFTALGDADGLLILVKEGRIWFPTVDVPARAFPVEIEVAGPSRMVEIGSDYRINVS